MSSRMKCYRTIANAGASSPEFSRSPRLILRLLMRSRYEIPDHGAIRCGLWRMQTGGDTEQAVVYAIGMKGLGYRRFCVIGRDLSRAQEIFTLLVRNTVTPCTLQDVLEEMPRP